VRQHYALQCGGSFAAKCCGPQLQIPERTARRARRIRIERAVPDQMRRPGCRSCRRSRQSLVSAYEQTLRELSLNDHNDPRQRFDMHELAPRRGVLALTMETLTPNS
jgi:hypothetical protein